MATAIKKKDQVFTKSEVADRVKDLIKEKDTVVVISTANGLKFTEFKVKYHNAEIFNTNKKFQNDI